MVFETHSDNPPISPTQKRIHVEIDQLAIASFDRPELIQSLVSVVEFVSSSSSGGTDALARLLMSCYNSHEYPFEVTELCRLDDNFYEHAINILRLRTRSNLEPHTFFLNGGKLFNQIAADFRLSKNSE